MGYQFFGYVFFVCRKVVVFVFFFFLLVLLYQVGWFCFLNKVYCFEDQIDWDFMGYGKFWAYNFNYFEYLCQEDLLVEQGLELMWDFMVNVVLGGNVYEFFLILLCVIFWIWFLMQVDCVVVEDIEVYLYWQLWYLFGYCEYYFFGNYLLENGFVLFVGVCYFQCLFLLQFVVQVFQLELQEQIFLDGGYFEWSLMYY